MNETTRSLSSNVSTLTYCSYLRDLSQGTRIYTRICSREARPAPVRRPGGRWLRPRKRGARVHLWATTPSGRTNGSDASVHNNHHANITREPSPTRRLRLRMSPARPCRLTPRSHRHRHAARACCAPLTLPAVAAVGSSSHHITHKHKPRTRTVARALGGPPHGSDAHQTLPVPSRSAHSRATSARAHIHTHTPVGREPARHK